jgi:hypothetical protein
MDDHAKTEILKHFDIIFPATMQSRCVEQDGWKDDYWKLFQRFASTVTDGDLYETVRSKWPRYRDLSEADVRKVDGMLTMWREWRYASARL